MKKNKQIKGKGQGKAVNRSKAISEGGTKGLLEGRNDISESGSEFGKGDRGNEYEQMLQKYEAEVRNHIKIEQQLKLHIECVQDKLDDHEKLIKKEQDSKLNEKSEVKQELERYKELLNLREKEITQLKTKEVNYKKMEETYKKKLTLMDNEKKELSQMLIKAQRNVSPFKGIATTHFNIIDDVIK